MIGSDFERFLLKDTDPGYGFSADALNLPGKGEPPVELRDDDGLAGWLHRDNVMIEMCVPPQHTGADLSSAVQRVIQAAAGYVSERLPDVTISALTSCDFRKYVRDTPHFREIGCDLDFLVGQLDSEQRPAPAVQAMVGRRFAGGHLHFSWDRADIPAWVGASVCDLLIGLREFPHLNPQRAPFYGLAGLHRPTRYPDGSQGVEYRPLDSYWTINPAARQRVCKLAESVHTVLQNAPVALLHKYVDCWRKLDASTKTLLALGNDRRSIAAVEYADGLFRKEYGYDPV